MRKGWLHSSHVACVFDWWESGPMFWFHVSYTTMPAGEYFSGRVFVLRVCLPPRVGTVTHWSTHLLGSSNTDPPREEFILLLHIRLMKARAEGITAFAWARVIDWLWSFEHSSVEGAAASCVCWSRSWSLVHQLSLALLLHVMLLVIRQHLSDGSKRLNSSLENIRKMYYSYQLRR